MVTDNNDILLDGDGDDQIGDGDFITGDGRLDDCGIIFRLNTGALKSDPVLAPNLITLINSKGGSGEIKKALRIHLERDSKLYKKLEVVNGVIDFEI